MCEERKKYFFIKQHEKLKSRMYIAIGARHRSEARQRRGWSDLEAGCLGATLVGTEP